MIKIKCKECNKNFKIEEDEELYHSPLFNWCVCPFCNKHIVCSHGNFHYDNRINYFHKPTKKEEDRISKVTEEIHKEQTDMEYFISQCAKRMFLIK